MLGVPLCVFLFKAVEDGMNIGNFTVNIVAVSDVNLKVSAIFIGFPSAAVDMHLDGVDMGGVPHEDVMLGGIGDFHRPLQDTLGDLNLLVCRDGIFHFFLLLFCPT
jgi:hypothetical protein